MGEGQGTIHHQQLWKDKWRGHSYGSHGYRWSGRRKAEHGDDLLLPQSSHSGGLWSALCPALAWLSGTKCGCSEEVHQFTLSPTGVLWFHLPRCDHSLWEHFIYPIPNAPATPMQASPLLWNQGGPATGGGRGRVKGVSLLPGDHMGKLWGRTWMHRLAHLFHTPMLWACNLYYKDR